MGFVHDKRFTFEIFSYDFEWENLSPSRLLQEHIIRWCIDNGIEEFDFLPALVEGTTYKHIWTNSKVQSTSYCIPTTLRGYVLLLWRRLDISPVVSSKVAISLYQMLPMTIRRMVRTVVNNDLQPVPKMIRDKLDIKV